MPKRIILAFWGVFMVLGTICGAVFAQGVMRDHRLGEPDVGIDLGRDGARALESFRVWGEERYQLLLSSVNHDPDRVGHRFEGAIQIAVLRPNGTERYRRVFDSGSLEHEVPANYGDARLETLTLSGWPFRTWWLEARVLQGDPGFSGVSTRVKLWEDRPPLGMGGLINYALLLPAAVFLALGGALSFVLWGHGMRWPLIVSAPLALAFLALFKL